jgi:two-component system, NarL family, invasion response regulator UvrY
MRILVADDHPIVRAGVSYILTKAFKGATIEEACNARQIFQQLGSGRWDLLLLDMTMPGRPGLDVLKQVREENPKLPVLVLSIHSETDYGIRALRAGASGYLTKETVPEQLLSAIKKVMNGGIYVSESLAERLAAGLRHNFDLLPHETLTDREYEVMRLIASGMRSGEIARKLSLSVKTISTFRAHVLHKLALKTNAAIIRYCIQHHLTD